MSYNYVSYATGVPMSSQTSPQLGRYIMTTAPTAKALTVTEVRNHLKISTTSENTYLDNLIDVATEMVQNYTSQTIITQTIDLHLPYFMNRININRSPISRINHVKYYDSSNSLQTVTDTNYETSLGVEDSSDQSPVISTIIPSKNFSYPDTYPRMDAVQIRFTCGYDAATTVPEVMRQAMLIIIGTLYLNRTDMVYKMPTLSEYLLNPYRLNVL